MKTIKYMFPESLRSTKP